MEWIVESGIPIPPRNTSKEVGVKGSPTDLSQAFHDLRVGQSIFSSEIDRYTLTNRYHRVSYSYGHQFTSRKMDGGTRVWRIR